MIGMPYYSTPLLSVWPSHYTFNVGRKSPKVPVEIMQKVKMVDFVGYAPNPGTFKRNQNLVLSNRTEREKPQFRSEQERRKIRLGKNEADVSSFSFHIIIIFRHHL